MIVRIDGGEPIEVLNAVKVIIGDGLELHVTVTHEGVITDAVAHGEIVKTECVSHDDHLCVFNEYED